LFSCFRLEPGLPRCYRARARERNRLNSCAVVGKAALVELAAISAALRLFVLKAGHRAIRRNDRCSQVRERVEPVAQLVDILR